MMNPPKKPESKKTKTKYSVDVMDTEKSQIPLRSCMKDGTLPRFPFSIMISGRSGSGKTMLLMNLLTKKEMYGEYFHYTIVYSPTAGSYDDTYKVLNLPAENFIQDFGKEELEKLIESRKALIKKKGIGWVAKNARILIVLDDIIANREFLESQTALKLFALLRHYLCSVCVLVQSYTKLPRALRLNCNGVFVFPALQSEVDVIKDECTPAGISKKEFEKVIGYACEEQFSFLYINNHAKPGQRVRKNLDEVINLDDYKK